MEKLAYSREDLMKLFQCGPTSIWRMEQDGRLKKLNSVPGCMYRAKEVFELLELGPDYEQRSPFAWRRLENENKELKAEVAALKLRLSRISAMGLGTLPIGSDEGREGA